MTIPITHMPGDLYFVTGSIIRWLPLFSIKMYSDIILNSIKWHRENDRMLFFAFVIMPEHLHWISKPLDPFTINHNIRSFASFTAHKILDTVRINVHDEYLDIFRESADEGKMHRIWQDFQAKNIHTQDFLLQKMEYIHNNPIKKNWFLSDDRSDYLYSSACYYDRGQMPIIHIDDLFEYVDSLR